MKPKNTLSALTLSAAIGCGGWMNLEPRDLTHAERHEVRILQDVLSLSLEDSYKGKLGSRALKEASKGRLNVDIFGSNIVDPEDAVGAAGYYDGKEDIVVLHTLASNPEWKHGSHQVKKGCDLNSVNGAHELYQRSAFLDKFRWTERSTMNMNTGERSIYEFEFESTYHTCESDLHVEITAGVLAHEYGHKITGKSHSLEHTRLQKKAAKAMNRGDYKEARQLNQELDELDAKEPDPVLKIGWRSTRAVSEWEENTRDEYRAMYRDAHNSAKETCDEREISGAFYFGNGLTEMEDTIQREMRDACEQGLYTDIPELNEANECYDYTDDRAYEIRLALQEYYRGLSRHNKEVCVQNHIADEYHNIRHTFSEEEATRGDAHFTYAPYLSDFGPWTHIEAFDPNDPSTWNVNVAVDFYRNRERS